MKRLLFYLVLGLAGGLLFTIYFDYNIKPDNCFFIKAAETGDTWVNKLRSESDAPCYVITGGSEIRMSIDPAYMHGDSGTRMINAAGQAGFGITCNIVHGLSYLHPGDTLIVSIKHTNFVEDNISANGLKYCWRRLGLKTFGTDLIKPTADNIGKIFQGSSGELCMYAIKRLLSPGNIYIYDKKTHIHETGWVENYHKKSIPLFSPNSQNISNALTLPTAEAAFLETLKAECDKRGAKLCTYFYIEYAAQTLYPHAAAAALTLTRNGIPVVRDPTMGIDSSQDSFADFVSHLSPQGSRIHSARLGRILSSSQKFWTEEELVDILRNLGYNEQGLKQ